MKTESWVYILSHLDQRFKNDATDFTEKNGDEPSPFVIKTVFIKWELNQFLGVILPSL